MFVLFLHQGRLSLGCCKQDTNSSITSPFSPLNPSPSPRTGCCPLKIGFAVAASANAAPTRVWKSIVAAKREVVVLQLAMLFLVRRSGSRLSSRSQMNVNQVFRQWDGSLGVPCSRALPAHPSSPHVDLQVDVAQASPFPADTRVVFDTWFGLRGEYERLPNNEFGARER